MRTAPASSSITVDEVTSPARVAPAVVTAPRVKVKRSSSSPAPSLATPIGKSTSAAPAAGATVVIDTLPLKLSDPVWPGNALKSRAVIPSPTIA